MAAAAVRVYWCAVRVVLLYLGSSVKFYHSLVAGAGKKHQQPAALRPARAGMHARAPGPSPGRGKNTAPATFARRLTLLFS